MLLYGIPNPTEINIGRFFTTHQFFSELGINMPTYYVESALDLPVSFNGRILNPAPDNMVWIRGMDFKPVLVSAAEIENNIIDLQKLRKDMDS